MSSAVWISRALHARQQRQGEPVLHQRLAARQRHAAARLVVERDIADDLGHRRVHGHLTADLLARVRETGVRTDAAPLAPVPVGDGTRRPPSQAIASRGARFACTAPQRMQRFCRAEHLRLERLAFGVVAPPAAQRATLQEDRGANAGAVVDGVSADVEDDAGGPDPLTQIPDPHVCSQPVPSKSGHCTNPPSSV